MELNLPGVARNVTTRDEAGTEDTPMARTSKRDERDPADALGTHHARIHELGRHPLWQVNDSIARGCTRGGLLHLADALDRLHQAHDGVAELESGKPVRPWDLLAAYDEGPGACTIYVDDPEYAAPVEH